MIPKAAYTLGRQLALEAMFVKTAGISDTARTFGDRLLGKNIDAVAERNLNSIINLPGLGSLEKQYKHTPADLDTIHSYIRNALHGGSKPITELANIPKSSMSAGDKTTLIEALNAGRKEVSTEEGASRMARLGLGGAIAVPIGGALALTKSSSIYDNSDSSIPVLAGGLVSAAPLMQGIQSGAVSLPEPRSQGFSDVNELRKLIRQGDIVLTGTPRNSALRPGKNKAIISASGGDPHGYHVETVVKKPNRLGEMDVIHATPNSGGAAWETDMLGKEDVIVRRFKDPAHTKQFLKNIKDAFRREQILGDVLGDTAQGSMYKGMKGARSGWKDLLPVATRNFFASRCSPGEAFCSSLPSLSSPVPLYPGIPAHEVMPHHVQKSKVLETVGHFYPPRSKAVSISEAALRTTPALIRGLLGAGLGYGAYRGAKALMNRD